MKQSKELDQWPEAEPAKWTWRIYPLPPQQQQTNHHKPNFSERLGPILRHQIEYWQTWRRTWHVKTTIQLRLVKLPHIRKRLWHQTDWKKLEENLSNFHLHLEAWESKVQTTQSVDFILEHIDNLVNQTTQWSKRQFKSKSAGHQN